MAHPTASGQALQGYLDRVLDGELTGWARDPVEPGRPVRVTVCVDGRPVAEALACAHRPDVAAVFGGSGRHGFHVDLARVATPGRGRLVTVLLPDGRPVGNCPLTAEIPSRPADPDEHLLFMHIPKTAGTSIREAMARHYRGSELVYLYPDPPGIPVDVSALPLEQRRRLRCIIGHFKFGLHRWLPRPSRYVTFVREPVARTISCYRHFASAAPAIITRDGQLLPLAEVLEQQITCEFDNLMVRYFAGLSDQIVPPGSVTSEHLRTALSNLRAHFAFVGLQEDSQAGFDDLAVQLGWPPVALGRSMVGRQHEPLGDRAEIEGLIRQRNRWDLELYEEIRGRRPRSA